MSNSYSYSGGNYPTGSNSYNAAAGNNYQTPGGVYPTGSNSYAPGSNYPANNNSIKPTNFSNNFSNFLASGTNSEKPPTPLSDFNAHLTNIDEFLGHYPWVLEAEKKAGIRRAYLLVGAVAIMSLIVLLYHGSDALCNLVGFIYPMYASFKALKTPVKDDDTEWLTYWVVYGFCTLIEDFCQSIFSENALSTIYFIAKIVFLVWLYLPQTKGANMIFKVVVEPILSKYEAQIDREVDKGESGVVQFGHQLANDPGFQQAQTLLKAGAQNVSVHATGYDALGRPTY